MMPDGAIVVNTSRGGLVDDTALIAALKSGKLFAAGLDVFENEPNLNPAYRELSNVFLLPHLGSATIDTRNAMGFKALDNLDAFFAGRPLDRPDCLIGCTMTITPRWPGRFFMGGLRARLRRWPPAGPKARPTAVEAPLHRFAEKCARILGQMQFDAVVALLDRRQVEHVFRPGTERISKAQARASPGREVLIRHLPAGSSKALRIAGASRLPP